VLQVAAVAKGGDLAVEGGAVGGLDVDGDEHVVNKL
jgi:hypothetical protein